MANSSNQLRPPGLPPDVEWLEEEDGSVKFPPGTPQEMIAAAEADVRRAKERAAASVASVPPRAPQHPPVETPPIPVTHVTREIPVYAGWPHTVEPLSGEERVQLREFFSSEAGVRLLVNLRAARGEPSLDYIRGYEAALDAIYTQMTGPKPPSQGSDSISNED